MNSTWSLSRPQKNDLIKIVAMVSMLIDHIGVIFYPQVGWLRVIGRIAFPIFAYGIAMGFHYTRDRKMYALRLLIFSIISQVPYMWLNAWASFIPYRINQIPQLLYAVGVLLVLEKGLKERVQLKKYLWIALSLVLAFIPDVLLSLSPGLSFGYGTYGVLMSMLFYVFRHDWLKILVGYLLLSFLGAYLSIVRIYAAHFDQSWWENFKNVSVNLEALNIATYLPRFSGHFLQTASIMALPILYVSEKRPTNFKLNRWIVYWFYPVHIGVLVILYKLIGG